MGDRDRSPRRRDRRSGGGNSGRLRKGPPEKRIFINNLPFEAKWQDVKDLFKKEIGEVNFVELFEDPDGRPRGAGVLEFASEDLAKQAVEKMHRFEFKGRKLVVKEDTDLERDKFGHIITDRDRERMRNRDRSGYGGGGGGGGGAGGSEGFNNTYGLSARFLESLGIDGPLHTRVFVANLSYDVDEKKIKEVFRLAGKVVGIELTRDKEGKSRGFAVVVYEHPVEAVQAISMFHDQDLKERRMSVRFDKVPEDEPPRNLNRLPDGLRNVGMGLGQDGQPLWNVKDLLPVNNNEGNTLGLGNMAMGMNMAQQQQQQQAQVNNTQAVALQAALTTIMGMAGANNPAAAAGLGQLGSLAGGMGLNSGAMGMANSRMGNSSMSDMNNMDPSAMNGGMGSQSMNDVGRGGLGGMDRGMSSMDRGMSSMDRGMSSMDRGMSSMDRGMSGMDRGMSSMSGMSGMDRGMSSMDRGMSSMDRGMPGMDRGMQGGMDRGMQGGMDRMASMDRGMSSMRSMNSRHGDKIMIKNLPGSMNWQAMKDKFCHVGEIKFAEMKERGVGVIRFASEREAERAVNVLNGERLDGRSLIVSIV